MQQVDRSELERMIVLRRRPFAISGGALTAIIVGQAAIDLSAFETSQSRFDSSVGTYSDFCLKI
jgi:hypothetical protein